MNIERALRIAAAARPHAPVKKVSAPVKQKVVPDEVAAKALSDAVKNERDRCLRVVLSFAQERTGSERALALKMADVIRDYRLR